MGLMFILLTLMLTLNPDTFDLHADSPETQRWKKFLLEVRQKQTEIALVNATTYVPIFRQIFQEEGVPDNLLWLAMIESSFRPDAQSPTGAGGMFQFKRETAKILGLRVQGGADERMEPEKAARAAAKYLSYLRQRFESWDLVLAAYNLGEGDLRRAMRRHGADEWEEIRPFIREETQNYVGKVKAAALIGNTHLESLESGQAPADQALEMPGNEENLDRTTTQVQTDLSLPPQATETPMESEPSANLETASTHTVATGETLWSISRRYGLTHHQLKRRNGLHNNHIDVGQVLRLR